MNPTILVVDDESIIRELLERHLTAMHCTVVTASTGEKAVGLLEEGVKPDLIFMDVRMPGMGGVKCLERMKHLYRDLTVIMLTAVEDVRVAQNALANGARNYITKPVDLTTITEIVNTYLLHV